MVVRYFRQGVNRYRESRRCSSSSKLMQHLTFRYILLELAAHACDSLVYPFFRSCLTTMYLLSFLLLFSFSSYLFIFLPLRSRWKYRHRRSNYRVSVFVIPALPKLARDNTCLDLPPRQAALLRERNALRRFLSYLPFSPVLSMFTDFSLFPPSSWQNIVKHMFRHLRDTHRRT